MTTSKALDQLVASARQWSAMLASDGEEGVSSDVTETEVSERTVMAHLGHVERVVLEMLQVLEFKCKKVRTQSSSYSTVRTVEKTSVIDSLI